MKGFSIEIQEGLGEEEQELAENQAVKFTEYTITHDMNFPLKGSAGRRSYIRRNRFGYHINKSGLVFRRISKRRRKFAVVRANELVLRASLSEVNLKQCMCPIHLGAERVVWRSGKPKTYEYIRIGKI